MAESQSLPISSSAIADKFIKYYWRQAVPFQNGHVLQQGHRDQVLAIKEIRRVLGEAGLSPMKLRRNAELSEQLRQRLAAKIREQPLRKLQRIGDREKRFLYVPQDRSYRIIELEPSAHQAFSELYELVTAAIQGKWAQHISAVKANREILGPQADLHGFLFGQNRQVLAAFKQPLKELQNGQCIYCDKPLRGSPQVDHFIPWSRYPLDEGCNLVLAHSSCNRAKKDHIPALIHLEKWVSNLNFRGGEFANQLQAHRLPFGEHRTRSVVDWAYSLAESAQLRLWVEGKQFDDCLPHWRSILAGLQPITAVGLNY